MSDDIRVLKTIVGEDLIAEIAAATETYYLLENPANLVLQETETGVRVALAPFMPYSEGNIKLYIHNIAAEANADPAMLKEYKRIHSPIVQPSSSLIMPR